VNLDLLAVILVELRLGVENVDGARRAFHEEPDDGPGLGREMWRPRRERIASALIVARRRAGRAEQVGEGAQPQPGTRPSEESPPRRGHDVTAAALVLVSRHK